MALSPSSLEWILWGQFEEQARSHTEDSPVGGNPMNSEDQVRVPLAVATLSRARGPPHSLVAGKEATADLFRLHGDVESRPTCGLKEKSNGPNCRWPAGRDQEDGDAAIGVDVLPADKPLGPGHQQRPPGGGSEKRDRTQANVPEAHPT